MASTSNPVSGGSNLVRYGARATAFLLPLVVAAAFLNLGQSSCCDSGDCTPAQCELEVVCQAEICSAIGFQPEGALCDLGSGVGSGVCDGAGTCGLNPCFDTAFCDDGDPCTAYTCDPLAGCIDLVGVVGAACDSGGGPGSGLCDESALCQANPCFGLPSDFCDDGNDCTDDGSCMPATGACNAPTPSARGATCGIVATHDGRCDGAGSCLAHEGDLQPTGVQFDPGNYLTVTIKNRSDKVLPEDRGDIAVFVDGQRVYESPLGDLPSDAYRQPGATQAIETGVRLAGNDRRVAIAVDTNDEILEWNESHNTWTRTITPPSQTGPDFRVDRLVLAESDEVWIRIENAGTGEGFGTLHFSIYVDGLAVADFDASVGLLAEGGFFTVQPSPAVLVSQGARVRVEMTAPDPSTEIDTVPSVREETLPYALPTEYATLLADPKIAAAINWEDDLGVRSYDEWSFWEKAPLEQQLQRLEQGDPQATEIPPNDGVPSQLAAGYAFNLYVAHLAHSLWADVHDVVPWKLRDYTPEELAYLLDGREYFRYRTDTNNYDFKTSIPLDGAEGLQLGTLSWNPRIAFEFLVNLDLIKGSHQETVFAVSNWMRSHLWHFTQAAHGTALEQYGYDGMPPLDKILYPLHDKRHVVSGCWGITALYMAMLRTTNIPVAPALTNLGRIDPPTDNNHSRPLFLTLDLSMPHADDALGSLTAPGMPVPVDVMFWTSEEIETLTVSPSLDCDGPVCNTRGAQSSYNILRKRYGDVLALNGDFLLNKYANEGSQGIHDSLTDPGFALELFSIAERDQAVADIEAELTRIGDGDIEAGKSVVSSRFTLWRASKRDY